MIYVFKLIEGNKLWWFLYYNILDLVVLNSE